MNWQVFALKQPFAKQYKPNKPSPLPAEAWEDTGLNIVSTSFVASQQKAQKKFPGRILNVVMDTTIVRDLRPEGCKCKKIGDNPKCPQHGVEDETPPPRHGLKKSSQCRCSARGDNPSCPIHGWDH